jgi:hypothetical protein
MTGKPRGSSASASDRFGRFVPASALPEGVKPPYRSRTIWTGEHRGWEIIVVRIEGDPLPHVTASGAHPTHCRFESHSERQEGATPTSVRAWVDQLLDQDGETP